MHDLKAEFPKSQMIVILLVTLQFDAPITDFCLKNQHLGPFTCTVVYVIFVTLFLWMVICINGITFKFMFHFLNDCELLTFFNHPKVATT